MPRGQEGASHKKAQSSHSSYYPVGSNRQLDDGENPTTTGNVSIAHQTRQPSGHQGSTTSATSDGDTIVPQPQSVPDGSNENADSFLSDWKQRQETLMTVYENMTQSSTPQFASPECSAAPKEEYRWQEQPPSNPVHHNHHQQGVAGDMERFNNSIAQGSSELMNIYDNLAQGSAPPTDEVASGKVAPQIAFDGVGGNISIPPVPDLSLGASDGRNPSSASESSRPKRRTSGRSSRKRPAPVATNDEGSTSGGSVTQQRNPKSRRKMKGDNDSSTDGRWSKRFTWPEELHRDFVAAIFDVGLKHASPSSILEFMPQHEQITSERVKSHLQKYRLHRAKSKRDFLTSYNESLKTMQKEGLGKFKSLSAGEVPAHLAYSDLSGKEVPAPIVTETEKGSSASNAQRPGGGTTAKMKPSSSVAAAKGRAVDHGTSEMQDSLMLPRLTEEEKKSPIGSSMGYLMGLFFSLKQQLVAQRVANAQKLEASNDTKHHLDQPVIAVFDSFVNGHPHPSGPQALEPHQQQQKAHDASTMPSQQQLPPPPQSQHSRAAISSAAATSVANPSTRSNLEESNMMKREMRTQMAFQNKMRALKQQEVNKYKRAGFPGEEQQQQQEQQQHDEQEQVEAHQRQPSVLFTDHAEGTESHVDGAAKAAELTEQEFQGAGEPASMTEGAGYNNRTLDRNRTMSFGASDADDFWNSDVVDEQLFEFLMNN